jgi:hypothetical protein
MAMEITLQLDSHSYSIHYNEMKVFLFCDRINLTVLFFMKFIHLFKDHLLHSSNYPLFNLVFIIHLHLHMLVMSQDRHNGPDNYVPHLQHQIDLYYIYRHRRMFLVILVCRTHQDQIKNFIFNISYCLYRVTQNL